MALKLCSGQIWNGSIHLQIEIRKLRPHRLCFSYDAELGHFTFSFCRGRQRNLQIFTTHVLCYCFAHWRSRWRRRRGLLKLPNIGINTTCVNLTSSRNSLKHFSLSSFNSFLALSMWAYILALRDAFLRIANSSLMFESPIFNDDCSRRRSAILKINDGNVKSEI